MKNTIKVKKTKFFDSRHSFSKFIHQPKEFVPVVEKKIEQEVKPVPKADKVKPVKQNEAVQTSLGQNDMSDSNPKSRIPHFWVTRTVSVKDIKSFAEKLTNGIFL